MDVFETMAHGFSTVFAKKKKNILNKIQQLEVKSCFTAIVCYPFLSYWLSINFF